MNRLRPQFHRALQSFQQRQVLGDIVVLPSNPFGDSDFLAERIIDDDANTGWPRIPQGPTIDIGD